MGSFIAELKRRNLFRVAAAYAIVGWLLIQVADVLFPAFQAPDWTVRVFTLFVVLGFPLAIFLAWVYELTPDGIKVASSAGPDQFHTRTTGQQLNYFIIGVLLLVIVFLLVDNYVLKDTPNLAADTAAPQAAVQTAPPAPDRPAAEAAAPQNSVAVLPFVNMSSDPEQEYFSDGISEELLNQLVRIPGLHVAGRTSSFMFKNTNEDLRAIGEKLNVAHVLEGSVRKANNRVRITAQLIKVSDGYHLFSETYDRELDDIFAIQEETARAVAGALSVTLGVGEGDLGDGGTRNFSAYDAYLSALSLYYSVDQTNIKQVIEHLESAVNVDPDFARAWALLAIAYQDYANTMATENTAAYTAKFRSAARRAIDIAPQALSSVQVAAQVSTVDDDWPQAEELMLKALELAPNDASANYDYAALLSDVGRVRAAAAYRRRAADLEPLAFWNNAMLGLHYELGGELDKALLEYNRARKLDANNAFLNSILTVLAMEMDDRELMRDSINRNAGLPDINQALNEALFALLDTPQAALEELHRRYQSTEYDNPISRSALAAWASYLGDQELALRAYRQLAADRTLSDTIIWRPIHKPMRKLPAFKDLVKAAGLLDYWHATGHWGDYCRPVDNEDFECE